MTLILASASPRRQELLERVGIAIVVRPSDIDESQLANERPLDYVRRVAAAKAGATALAAGEWVLAADTIVEVDGLILGKAVDAAEAAQMLRRLSGRTHRVSTALALRGPSVVQDLVVTSEVDFVELSSRWIDDYALAGEWRGKAGAYAVQGMAAVMVKAVRGSSTNVIGLPLAEVVELLHRHGVADVEFGRGRPA